MKKDRIIILSVILLGLASGVVHVIAEYKESTIALTIGIAATIALLILLFAMFLVLNANIFITNEKKVKRSVANIFGVKLEETGENLEKKQNMPDKKIKKYSSEHYNEIYKAIEEVLNKNCGDKDSKIKFLNIAEFNCGQLSNGQNNQNIFEILVILFGVCVCVFTNYCVNYEVIEKIGVIAIICVTVLLAETHYKRVNFTEMVIKQYIEDVKEIKE